MSALGDKLRAVADKCDAEPKLTGVIFVSAGDVEILLAAADSHLTAFETVHGLTASVANVIIGVSSVGETVN